MVEKAVDVRILNELITRTNEDTRRIRLLEQRLEKLSSSFSRLEETAIVQLKNLEISLEKLGNKVTLVSDRLKAIEDEILRINKELAKTAKKTDITQIEGYIDLINPITSRFVTRDELENYINERLGKKV